MERVKDPLPHKLYCGKRKAMITGPNFGNTTFRPRPEAALPLG